jgi:hypothetical protein
MVVSCEEVWREISNYLEGDVDPSLSAAMEEHFRGCKHCTAVLDGTRNVVQLYGDDRMVELPIGFSRRLHQRLEANMSGSRRRFLGWIVTAAAAAMVLGGFEIGQSLSGNRALRSEQARTGNGIPPDMTVVVSAGGKLFHLAGCPFIHDKARVRTMVAREAEREGYVPCVRCLRKYLKVS